MLKATPQTKYNLKALKKKVITQRTLTGKRNKLSEGNFKDKCIYERDQFMLANKGGFERIYPPETGHEKEPYNTFLDHAQEFYDRLTGNDFIRSRGYSKSRTGISNTMLGGVVRRRQKSLAEIYGVKKLEPKTKKIITPQIIIQETQKEKEDLVIESQEKTQLPKLKDSQVQEASPAVPNPAENHNTAQPSNERAVPNTPQTLLKSTKIIKFQDASKSKDFHTFIPKQAPQVQSTPIITKSMNLKPIKKPKKLSNPIMPNSTLKQYDVVLKTNPNDTNSQFKEYHMENPLKTEHSVSSKQNQSKKSLNPVKTPAYNPKFSQTIPHSIHSEKKSLLKNGSSKIRLGSTHHIDTSLRKIPQLNKNHSVSNLRRGYRQNKRPIWRKKAQKNGPEYFLSPYVMADPFLKNLKRMPKLKIMRKIGKY